MNCYSQYAWLEVQVAVTDIYTPKGDCIHKVYNLDLEEISQSNLRYTSKFPIPLGTKMCINVVFQGEKVRILADVIGNQRSGDGKFSVVCRILYGDSGKARLFSTGDWLKSHSISVIH